MAQDIYGRQTAIGGAFSADSAVFDFSVPDADAIIGTDPVIQQLIAQLGNIAVQMAGQAGIAGQNAGAAVGHIVIALQSLIPAGVIAAAIPGLQEALRAINAAIIAAGNAVPGNIAAVAAALVQIAVLGAQATIALVALNRRIAEIGVANFGAGMLLQSVQFQYQQNATRIYELGSPAQYYVVGRTQGQATAARIIGPTRLAVAFYRAYGNACNVAKNNLNITMQTGCEVGGLLGQKTAYNLRQVLLISISGNVTAQDFMFNEQLGFMFSHMDVDVRN